MRHDQRQRILMPRPDVDEVDLDPVDLGRELRKRVQSRLALAPVVLACPVAGEFPHRRQPHALRSVWDELLGGPARGCDARTQRLEFRLGDLDRERPDRCVFGRAGHMHPPGFWRFPTMKTGGNMRPGSCAAVGRLRYGVPGMTTLCTLSTARFIAFPTC